MGACSPRKILNLDPLRLLLTQSETRLLFNTCDKTIITILNFKISWGGGGGIVAGGKFPAPTFSVDPLSVIRSEVVVQFRNQAEWFESWLNDLEAGLQAA